MLSDPIADMITRIRNAQSRQKDTVEIMYSKENVGIAKVLAESKYIAEVKVYKPEGKAYKKISVKLRYDKNGSPRISMIARISRPGLRKYVKSTGIKSVLGGIGISIMTTSQGIMSDREARKRKLGGELICSVY
ncbi:30S ribosomal protein S8 [candidate division WWE3 bacterium RIFCSPLOWO2_01_FULL_39_13]|uniref:Small ribosomal subunit protein uS8 n=1 Tax=candidate division WWE3 bacterium RIFCSPLOWO2_01_FULL_39_13 TaxID=1802624 RepID=A0A1F4V4R9_UNCKA|nr:MAG: 30S ribosomal protein S8 [candidate division WWE3 bacterium RIFCSPLOWO2_01_FULL_39_13]